MKMPRSSVPGENSRSERLRAAAAALFRRKGYASTTTRELAKVIGIKSASLYYHIGKKEDLLYDLSVDALNRMHQQVRQAMSEHAAPGDRLRAMILTHVTSALENPDKHAAMLFELRSLSDERRAEVIRLRDTYQDLVRQTIADAQAAGVVRNDIAPEHMTLALMNLLNWSIFWFTPGGQLRAEQFAELFLTLFLEGAAAQRSAAARDRPA